MELKTARLTLLMDPHKKAAFEQLCARQDRSASQVVRQLIREYLAQHGVDYTVVDEEAPAEPMAHKRRSAPRKVAVAPAPAPAPARRARRR